MSFREGPKAAEARLAKAKAREEEAKKSWNERLALVAERQKHNPWLAYNHAAVDYNNRCNDGDDDGPEMLPRPSASGKRRHELDLMSTAYYRTLGGPQHPVPPPSRPWSVQSEIFEEERAQRIADEIMRELRAKARLL
jgi:hypothetical protein